MTYRLISLMGIPYLRLNMLYKIATPDNFPAIKKFVDATGYFWPVEPEKIGGHWLIAIHKNKICGTVWFFGEPPHAYVDYWVGRNVIATRLGAQLEDIFKKAKVKFVRGMIHTTNLPAIKLAMGLGMKGDGPYVSMYKDIDDGREENRTDNNNSAENCARTGDTRLTETVNGV